MSVIDEIAAERLRQMLGEGFDEGHDDEHDAGELADAAARYAAGRELLYAEKVPCRRGPRTAEHPNGRAGTRTVYRRLWPWGDEWLKPKSRRRNLIRAAALVIAEIERLDRAEKRKREAE